MEFNLPPWLFTWAQLFFMAYIFLAVVPAAKFLFENNFYIGNFRQNGIVHYVEDRFLTDNIIEGLEESYEAVRRI